MAFPSNEKKLYDFLVTYRKVITILCIADLVLLPIKLFYLPRFEPGHQYQTIGYWLDTMLWYAALPVVALIFVQKAKKSRHY